jgi:dTDP-4-amino-4,6-dideoxygalactose transaminase
MTRIPIAKPFFGEEELAAVIEPLKSGWIVQGPRVAEFERLFATYSGAPHAVAASNCTTALHMAVAALALRPGDEVIVPAFTWVSTANVVEYMGAKPVFCDIDLATYNIDVRKIEPLITERTVGLLPVHLFGLCADMDPILDLARTHGLWVVEDAACAFGAWYGGRHAGTMGDVGCFSFHPRKSITTGEGGMITTARDDLARKTRSLRDHGASRSDLAPHQAASAFLLAEYDDLGYNYRMTDLQAAVGCVQMSRAAAILDGRRHRARIYDEALQSVEWLRAPVVPEGYVHGYQAYVCLFRPEELSLANLPRIEAARNRVMTGLENEGIATRQGTHAAALTGYYRRKYGNAPEQFPNAAIAEGATLALPLYPQMTDAEQDEVCERLRRWTAE